MKTSNILEAIKKAQFSSKAVIEHNEKTKQQKDAKEAKQVAKQAAKVATPTDNENAIADSNLTRKVFYANCKAASMFGKDQYPILKWRDAGYTVKECNEALAEYNRITGYVKPAKKEKPKTTAKGKESTLAIVERMARENGKTVIEMLAIIKDAGITIE